VALEAQGERLTATAAAMRVRGGGGGDKGEREG
jgi:hypothetical protein